MIVLVDDNAAHRHLIRRAVKRSIKDGEIVEIASLGDALKFIDIHGCDPVEIFIVDLNLGDGKGTELVRALRDRCETTPVLLLSTSKLEEDREDANRSGASLYIVKDDDPEIFFKQVADGLKKVLG